MLWRCQVTRSEIPVTLPSSRPYSACRPIPLKPPLPRRGQHAAVAVERHLRRHLRRLHPQRKAGTPPADSIALPVTRLRSVADLVAQLLERPRRLASAAAGLADSRGRVERAGAGALLAASPAEQAGRWSWSSRKTITTRRGLWASA